MEKTKLMQFYEHPKTAKIRRTVQVSIQNAPKKVKTEDDRVAKMRVYNHALLMEMENDPEFRHLTLNAGLELICSELVSSTDFEHRVELTPQEQIGIGIANMIFSNLLK